MKPEDVPAELVEKGLTAVDASDRYDDFPPGFDTEVFEFPAELEWVLRLALAAVLPLAEHAPAPAGVLTADDLDALPVGAHVVDADGDVWEKRTGWWLLNDALEGELAVSIARFAPELRP